MEIRLDTRRVIGTIAWVSGALVALHGIVWGAVSLVGADPQTFWVELFDLDHERNIPTLFSSLLLLGCAGLFMVEGLMARRNSEPSGIWHGLGAIFIFLAVDETAGFHEALVPPLRRALYASGISSMGFMGRRPKQDRHHGDEGCLASGSRYHAGHFCMINKNQGFNGGRHDMKAAVFYGIGDIRLEERPDPVPGPGEVVVRVRACGICGTDRHIYHGEFETRPPVVIGHEMAGEVYALGEGVDDLAIGQPVAVDPNIYCGTCRACRRGKIQMCANLQAIGVTRDGGFAELCLVPRAQCYPLPQGVTMLEGAMVEPLACCVHGIDLAGIVPGDRVAVIGGGAIGQMLAQLARLSGAAYVLVSDPLPERREMALHLGADAVIDPQTQDPLCPGGPLEGGADVIIEAVGSRRTTAQAIAWATAGGTILWFGVTPPGESIEVEPNLVFQKELTIRGARINPHTHGRAVALLGARRLQVTPLITRQIALEDLPGVLASPAGRDIKTVVCPS